jgi:hypothetical protein
MAPHSLRWERARRLPARTSVWPVDEPGPAPAPLTVRKCVHALRPPAFALTLCAAVELTRAGGERRLRRRVAPTPARRACEVLLCCAGRWVHRSNCRCSHPTAGRRVRLRQHHACGRGHSNACSNARNSFQTGARQQVVRGAAPSDRYQWRAVLQPLVRNVCNVHTGKGFATRCTSCAWRAPDARQIRTIHDYIPPGMRFRALQCKNPSCKRSGERPAFHCSPCLP